MLKPRARNILYFVLRVFRILVIIILIPIALFYLALNIGFITDLAVTPLWYKAQHESLAYCVKLKQSSYYSPQLSFTKRNENAWNYYMRAIQWIAEMPSEDKQVFYTFNPECNKTSISDSERVVQRYARAIAVWDTGTTCRYCTIPLDYEQGVLMTVPNYYSLQRISELAVIKARLDISKGNTQSAANSYIKALKSAADIGGGVETIIARMGGVAIGAKVVGELRTNLNNFDLKTVIFLKDALGQIERSWPRFDKAIEAEGRAFLTPVSTGWDGMQIYNMYGPGAAYKRPVTVKILDHIAFSLVSWNHWFSIRLTSMATAQRYLDVAERCNSLRSRDWEHLQPIVAKTDSDVERDSRRLDITVIPFPSITRMYKRIYVNLIMMRVLEAAFCLREYKLNNNKFPDNLESFLASDTTNYDLANSKPFHFYRDSTGQIIRLYSIGLNLKDDKGEGNPKDWFSGEKDDIWVEVK